MMDNKDWWNINAEKQLPLFTQWVGGGAAPTKKYIRERIGHEGYDTCLDCGCGLCDNYFSFKVEESNVKYTGIDTCEYFCKRAVDADIDVRLGSIEAIPFADNFFDVVYTRHTLEHLNDFTTAIKEMVRVAKHEVIIIFFIPPAETERMCKLTVDGILVPHNTYSKKAIEAIAGDDYEWVSLGSETALHIRAIK